MPTKTKILFICQEIYPYLPQSDMSGYTRRLIQAMQESGCETRSFMPRFGTIKERHNQLHEVIRLSGMNIILNGNDHQLIIKVASIPSARVQIYFIDNDDHFSRKATLYDPQSGEPFADNGQRSIFFARGVLETIRELRWQPDIIHCHGWFSSVVPILLRHAFADDPLFSGARIVTSLYGDAYPGSLSEDFLPTLRSECPSYGALDGINDATYENLTGLVISNTDGVVIEQPGAIPEGSGILDGFSGPVLDNTCKDDDSYLENIRNFYGQILQ